MKKIFFVVSMMILVIATTFSQEAGGRWRDAFGVRNQFDCLGTSEFTGKVTATDTVLAATLRATGIVSSSGKITSYDSVFAAKRVRSGTDLVVGTTATVYGASTLTGKVTGGDTVLAVALRATGALSTGGTNTFYGDVNYGAATNITHGALTHGTDVFTTQATEDTVTIAGAGTGDIYLVSGFYTAGVDQQDVLEWEAIAGKLVVHRLASGESALKYSWLRVK